MFICGVWNEENSVSLHSKVWMPGSAFKLISKIDEDYVGFPSSCFNVEVKTLINALEFIEYHDDIIPTHCHKGNMLFH